MPASSVGRLAATCRETTREGWPRVHARCEHLVLKETEQLVSCLGLDAKPKFPNPMIEFVLRAEAVQPAQYAIA